jgi:hypothetical protein
LRRPLHEQHDVVRFHFIFDELLDAHDQSLCAGLLRKRSYPPDSDPKRRMAVSAIYVA